MATQLEIRQAKKLLEAGDRAGARDVLQDLVRREPENTGGWSLLFTALENPPEKLECLRQIARLRPKDETARERLKKYKASAEFRNFKAGIHEERRKVEEEKIKAIHKQDSDGGLWGKLKALFAPLRRSKFW